MLFDLLRAASVEAFASHLKYAFCVKHSASGAEYIANKTSTFCTRYSTDIRIGTFFVNSPHQTAKPIIYMYNNMHTKILARPDCEENATVGYRFDVLSTQSIAGQS